MRDLLKRNHLLALSFVVSVVLAASSSWAAPVSTNKAAAGPDLKVMELGGGYHQNTGDLQFMNNKLVFTSEEGKADSLSLEYGDLKTVEFKNPRLLKIETANGEHKAFATVGAEKFDSNTLAFLKDHLGSSVELKSHIQ